MFLRFLTLIFACFLSLPAHAGRVEVTGSGLNIDPEGAAYAIFPRFNDLWIVFDGPATLAAETESLKSSGILTTEKLAATQGAGVRLQYKKLPAFHVFAVGGALTFSPSSVAKLSGATGGPANILALRDRFHLSGPALETFVHVHSYGTGETYFTGLTNGPVLNAQQKDYTVVRELPHYAGLPFVADDGSVLQAVKGKDGGFRLRSTTAQPVFTLPQERSGREFLAELTEKTAPHSAALQTAFSKTVEQAAPVKEHEDGEKTKEGLLPAPALTPLPNPQVTGPEREAQAHTNTAGAEDTPPLTQDGLSLSAPSPQTVHFQDTSPFGKAVSKLNDTLARVEQLEKQTQKVPAVALPNDIPADALALPVVREGDVSGDGPDFAGADTFVPSYEGPAVLSQEDVLFPPYQSKPFIKQEQRFIEALKGEDEENDQRLYLRLAKLNFAHGRYPEALGWLGKLEKEDDIPVKPHGQLLVGAASTLIGEPEKAIPLLSAMNTLPADRDLWLAAAYSATDRPKEAIDLFKENMDASNVYPLTLQKELRMAEARALFSQKQFTRLENALLALSELDAKNQLSPEAELLMAQMYLMQDDIPAGEQLLAKVSRNDTNPEAAYIAQYTFVNHLLEHGDLESEQAVEHLENLRHLWRGGQLEQDILYELGRLYFDQGRYRQGLDRLKYFTTYFSKSPRAKAATGEMTDVFTDLFFDAQKLADADPLQVLSMYYEFRELTPTGKKGDELILNVSKRLQEIGLFDRAVTLLEQQLKYRTEKPEDKARLGQELAELYYLNLRYDDGLRVLKQTSAPNLPPQLVRDRALVHSKLLMAMGDFNKAQEIILKLADDKSHRMRAELAWQQADYPTVIKNLSPFYENPENYKHWEEQDRTDFLKLAIAYSMAGLPDGLDALATRYDGYVSEAFPKGLVTFLEQYHQALPDETIAAFREEERPMARVITHMAAFNDFEETYQRYYDARETEKKQRAWFNRRMGQPTPKPVFEGLSDILPEEN